MSSLFGVTAHDIMFLFTTIVSYISTRVGVGVVLGQSLEMHLNVCFFSVDSSTWPGVTHTLVTIGIVATEPSYKE